MGETERLGVVKRQEEWLPEPEVAGCWQEEWRPE